jgi:hypothetical protein
MICRAYLLPTKGKVSVKGRERADEERDHLPQRQGVDAILTVQLRAVTAPD